ncbi:MAG: FecR domain-containing protein [Verrucomicrobiota bacterium]
MKSFLLFIIFAIIPLGLWADDLQKARFTEVIRDVKVTTQNSKDTHDVKVNDLFEVPQVIRTGMDSRAELEAPDKTIARVGANTIFSFETTKRTMNLQSGSVLFHSPKGMGGGTIKTAAATAAVTGTTIMVGATSNGGFKLMVMEGKSRVILPSGDNKVLNPGQMTFIVPGRNVLGPVLEFNLQRAFQGSSLIQGFDQKVASTDKMTSASNKQQKDIKRGKATSTEMEMTDAVGDGVVVVDSSLLEKSVQDPTRQNVNSFPLLKAYLDAHQSIDLNLNTSSLSGVDSFFSTSSAEGTFEGFSLATVGPYGAIGGRNITFSASSYDLSSFSSAKEFGFIATNSSMSFSSGATFSGVSEKLRFLNTAGQIFLPNSTILTSSKVISFEALGNIGNTAATLTIDKITGQLDKVTMLSRSGVITLYDPVFNSKVTELSAGTVTINNFSDLNSYTGAKTMYVYTDNGSWNIGTNALAPGNTGGLSIGSLSAAAGNSGVAGTQVSSGPTTYTIYSYKR